MNNVDVSAQFGAGGDHYVENDYNDEYGDRKEGTLDFDRNDRVAEALSDV